MDLPKLELECQDERLTSDVLRLSFARAWMGRDDIALIEAQKLIPHPADFPIAVICAGEWVKDPFVKAEVERMAASMGDAALIPSREKTALYVYKLTEEAKTITDKLNCIRTFADIVGYTKGGNSPGITNNITANKVLMIKDKGTETEWSDSLAKQQRTLIAEARAESIH